MKEDQNFKFETRHSKLLQEVNDWKNDDEENDAIYIDCFIYPLCNTVQEASMNE